MRFEPQRAGRNGRINSDLPPPRGFVAATMHLAMVPSTQGHGELIADLAPERPALRKAQVMGIRGLATANQTRLLGHMSDVIAVPNPARLRQGQRALIDHLRSRPVLRLRWMRAVRSRGLRDFPAARGSSVPGVAKLASLAWKPSSTRRASAAVSLFFSASDRCAQSAASSPPASSLSSPRSRSRSAADASGPSVGSAGFD